MTLSSPEVVELDSSAEVVWVLPCRDWNSFCVLIPDDRVASPGFHDVTLVD